MAHILRSLALLMFLTLAFNSQDLSADWCGPCHEPARLIMRPSPRCCVPEPPPPCPQRCHMPCCPPSCRPIESCCEPMPCAIPCPPICPRPLPALPCFVDNNCYGSFYGGANAFHLDLQIHQHSSKGLGWGYGDGKRKQRLKANLYGASVGFEYLKPLSFYSNLEFNWSVGRTGHDQNNDRSEGCRRFLHYYEAHWLLGYTLAACCDSMFSATPFAGFGYRYVDHHITETGADLRYRTYYVPVGLRLDISCYDFLDIGLKGQWLFQVDPTVRLNKMHQVRFVLEKRQSYMVEMPLTYSLCNNRFALIINPFYRRFVDGSSHRLSRRHGSLDIKIPKQVNQEWGGQLMLSFGF